MPLAALYVYVSLTDCANIKDYLERYLFLSLELSISLFGTLKMASINSLEVMSRPFCSSGCGDTRRVLYGCKMWTGCVSDSQVDEEKRLDC